MARRLALLVSIVVGLLPVFALPSPRAAAEGRSGESVPTLLIGSWSAGSVSGITFQNPLTGEYAPPTGAGERYTFAADGHYVYGGLLQTSFYGCTSAVFLYATGRLVADKNTLTLTPDQSAVVSKDTCNKKNNYTKPGSLAKETYRWALDQYQRGTKLCLQQRAPKAAAQPNCEFWLEGSPRSKATAVNAGTGTAFWHNRSSGTSLDLFGVGCGNTQDCVAVGWKLNAQLDDDTVALHSVDGGTSWLRQLRLGGGIKLRGASCAQAGTCLVVGDSASSGGVALPVGHGTVVWTANALGANSGAIHGIGCAGMRVCVAVGLDGAMLTSVNGGASWTGRRSSTTKTLAAVSCPSVSLCVVVGEAGTVLTSTDAGSTWTNRVSGTSDDLDGVTCLSNSVCLAVGGGRILASTNAGASWSPHSMPPGTYDALQTVTCFTSSGCVAVGESGAILASADGGATWATRASGTNNNLYGVACPSSTRCVAVGMNGTVLASADGGATWHAGSSGTTQSLRGVSCAGPTRCLAVGDDGAIRSSIDGGGSWSSSSAGTDDAFTAVACPSTTDCLAATPRGVLTTTDGGVRWSIWTPAASTALNGVSCPSTTSCVAVGYSGAEAAGILTSVDSGRSWSNRATSSASTLEAVSCPSARICVAVGNDGLDLTSADGGVTWTSRHSGIKDTSLYGVSCPSTRVCIAVGGELNGIVLSSHDGGVTWSTYESFDDITHGSVLYGVGCANLTFCVAVGQYGTILTTADGGEHWTSQVASGGSKTTTLNGVTCSRGGTCLAVGTGGAILRLS